MAEVPYEKLVVGETYRISKEVYVPNSRGKHSFSKEEFEPSSESPAPKKWGPPKLAVLSEKQNNSVAFKFNGESTEYSGPFSFFKFYAASGGRRRTRKSKKRSKKTRRNK